MNENNNYIPMTGITHILKKSGIVTLIAIVTITSFKSTKRGAVITICGLLTSVVTLIYLKGFPE
jgi:hypothetical protein